MSKSGSSITYGYNADGKRISKTINGTTYNYAYLGDQLTEMTWGSNKLRFGLYGFIFAFVSRGG